MTKTKEQKELLQKVQAFVDRAQTDYDSLDRDWEARIRRQEELFEEVRQFDQSLGAGLEIGRLVHWPQGDGRAYYFVVGINARMVRLNHLPWGDAWRSPVVVDGQAMRSAVEQALRASMPCAGYFHPQRHEKPNRPPASSFRAGGFQNSIINNYLPGNMKKDYTPVQWTMPRWAAELIFESVKMDSESIHVDRPLRKDLARALDTITETDVPKKSK